MTTHLFQVILGPQALFVDRNAVHEELRVLPEPRLGGEVHGVRPLGLEVLRVEQLIKGLLAHDGSLFSLQSLSGKLVFIVSYYFKHLNEQ